MKQIIILSLIIIGIGCKKESIDPKEEDTLKKGLVAYYPFNGNANDVSGNLLNGILQNGPQLSSDRFGAPNSAFYFDGENDNIIVHDNGQLSQPIFTIAYHFNTEKTGIQVAIGKINESTGNGATYISGVYPEPMSNPYFGLMEENSGCDVQVPNSLMNTLFTTIPVNTNQWYCMVSTFENGKQSIYMDGMLVATAIRQFPHAKFCTNTDFIIGSWWVNDKNSFQGKVDEVRYYNRALSLAEVKALCVAQK